MCAHARDEDFVEVEAGPLDLATVGGVLAHVLRVEFARTVRPVEEEDDAGISCWRRKFSVERQRLLAVEDDGRPPREVADARPDDEAGGEGAGEGGRRRHGEEE